MTRVVADIPVSLDGFVTGPGPGPDNGLGDGGEALHTWAFSADQDDRRVLRGATARSGAVVLGRCLFDVGHGPYGWDDRSGYGAGGPAFVVVTGAPPRSVRPAGLDWTFVTTGLPDADAVARERAGRRRGPPAGTSAWSSWAAAPRSAPPWTRDRSTR